MTSAPSNAPDPNDNIEMEDPNLADLADYDIGFQAGLDGKPDDPLTQSKAWQLGWSDSQE